jgi:kynurenine formamidase
MRGMRIIDLSQPLAPNASEPVAVEVEHISHARGGDLLGAPAGIGASAFPDGLGLSLEMVRAASHAGTHVDAPAHYGPLCEGRPARTIDELPLDWFFGDGVVIDCRRGRPDEDIGAAEIEERLAATGYEIRPFDIVLIWTGGERLWGRPEYFTEFRGMSRAATCWLLERGVKVIGIDTFGFDPPFHVMLDRHRASGRAEDLWPAHVWGRHQEYCQIERLANLEQIDRPFGFKVACFPIKLTGCGAGWSRVVALLDETGGPR